MKKSELKQLIREVIEEISSKYLGPDATAAYAGDIFLGEFTLSNEGEFGEVNTWSEFTRRTKEFSMPREVTAKDAVKFLVQAAHEVLDSMEADDNIDPEELNRTRKALAGKITLKKSTS